MLTPEKVDTSHHESPLPTAVAKKEKEINEKYFSEKPVEGADAPPVNQENTDTALPTQPVVTDPPAEAPVDAAVTATPDEAPTGTNWQKRFKVLQGKYDHEVKYFKRLSDGLAAEKKTIEANVSRLEGQIEVLSKMPVATAEPKVSETELLAKITDVLGDEAGDAIKQMFENRSPAQTAAPIVTTEPAPTATEETTEAPGREEFYDELDQFVVGDWREINSSAGFVAWQNKTKSASVPGETVYDDLRRFFYTGDSLKVADIFNRYTDELAAADNGIPEENIHPSPSTTATPKINQDEVGVVKSSEVLAFYKTVENGLKGVGSPVSQADQDAFSFKMQKAVADGKYVQDT